MKRHETLAPLSREHHDALILAQLLKKDAPQYKGLPVEPEGKSKYALQYFETGLQSHFIKEEKMLDQVKQYHPRIAALAKEIKAEHIQLKTLFTSLHDTKDLPAALDQLGLLLEAHIRKEERVLFPLIQEHCPGEVLEKIIW